jgi:hypothetical protein
MSDDATTNSTLTTLLEARPPALPAPADVMTVLVEVPPGDPGTPPHLHSGPVFGYVTEGELRSEREAVWEAGGDRLHLHAANNLGDAWTRFVAVMVCAPGQPMLTVADAAEVERRRAAAG